MCAAPASTKQTQLHNSEAETYLRELANTHGANRRSHWRNNNSTVREILYRIDMRDLLDTPFKIFRSLFSYNCSSGQRPLVAVPVAGWEPAPVPLGLRCLPLLSSKGRTHRLDSEYAQSFSLSDQTTAKYADIALRVSKVAQRMELFKRNGRRYLRIPAGARITDIDQFLFKKGYALPPNMPTLHVASFVGAAANGCYGPGFGPMTDNIVEIKGCNALGQPIVLSKDVNPELFEVLRDCHLGTLFVSEVTIGNIEPKYLMKRNNVLLADVNVFQERAGELSWMVDGKPFIFMYIPVDITEEGGDHFPRIRVTTLERADEKPPKKPKGTESKRVKDFLDLMTAEAGEPLIDRIVGSKRLRQFFPLIHKSAAVKTYGCDPETTEIDWSAEIYHIFRTYTDLPIYDYNWLIQVDSPKEGMGLLIDLMQMVEKELKECARKDKYPLFNVFARYLKGIHLPPGTGGIAPTAIDHEGQSILSFELLTYGDLYRTKSFKRLIGMVVGFLNERGLKFKYHPGKHCPENVRSLTDIFKDVVDQQRLERFQDAVVQLHGGKDNLPFSPILTDRKKEFIGLAPVSEDSQDRCAKHCTCSEKQEKQALQAIIELAEQDGDKVTAERARGLQSE